ncbi:pantoate--beta-alanine ligase [Mesohalobacter halotolerans]|uniref:Pantothenate synthetase n=1 Tax=Mesohalobacter halotolerans TaxID=1883405 RepID=A0A4U5TWF9_9FLAO|nr:pantoate--beta-alanine ligase [Mesohalobacter halotolerans]TKS57578.1 pantoate--beta-alanine ligase [Mesohalobacter halotolerans]
MIFKNISDLRHHLIEQLPNALGLVPTMGALHDGHLSIIKDAIADCDVVVVSIFVNPTQFNDPKDLSNYPRTLKEDVEKINQLHGNILIYCPSVKEVYPHGVVSETFDFGSLSKYMEGQYRGGHFDGVGTVLKRLFQLVKPNKAYFGKKDYQQFAIVKKLVDIENFSIEVIGCETYRESNGLAKSSRNKLLSKDQMQEAEILYSCLKWAKENFHKQAPTEMKKKVKSIFTSKENFKLEYFEIADENDLVPVVKLIKGKRYRAFIAAYCSGVRLIDNIALN